VGFNPARGMDVCLCFCVCVKTFATGRSFVQNSPNKCLNRLRNLACEEAKVLIRIVEQHDDYNDK
jgi:hypothetical protein